MTRLEHAYIARPPWARWLQRILLAMSYSLVVMTGLQAVTTHGGWFLDSSGWVMILGGVIATGGALARLYNIESIGLYIGIAGLLGGAFWVSGTGAWYTAYVVLAVTAFIALRLLSLTRVAAVARVEHELSLGGE